MSKGGGTQTTTKNSEPWAAQQPYLKKVFSEAQNIYNQGGPAYYPNNTLAPIAPNTLQSLDLMTQRAQGGSPLQNAGLGQAYKTIQGDYLSPDSNPYLQATFNRGAQNIRQQVGSAWGGSDSMAGSPGERAALGNALANFGNQLYGGNYQTERSRQATMTPMAPGLANTEYSDMERLAGVGDAQRQLAQNYLNQDINRYNYNQNLPLNNLANFSRMVQGNYGGSATQTTPMQSNSVLPMLASLGMAAFGGPAGMAGSLGKGSGFASWSPSLGYTTSQMAPLGYFGF